MLYQVLLDEGFYHQELKPLLLDWVALWMEAQQLTGIADDMVKRYLMHGFSDPGVDTRSPGLGRTFLKTSSPPPPL